MECTQDKSRDNQVLSRDYQWPLEPEDGATKDLRATTLQSTAAAVLAALVAVQEPARVTSMFQAAVGQAPIHHRTNTPPSAVAEEHTSINKADANTAFESMPGIEQSH